MIKGIVRDGASVFAAFAAIGVGIYTFTNDLGLLGTVQLWPLHITGLVLTALAIRLGGGRWLLLLTPFFFIPLVMGVTLLYA